MTLYTKIKRRAHEILEISRPNDKVSRSVDIVLLSLILLNVALIIADTFELPPTAAAVGSVIENISVAIFPLNTSRGSGSPICHTRSCRRSVRG